MKKDFEIYKQRVLGVAEEWTKENKEQLLAFVIFCAVGTKFLTTSTCEKMFKGFFAEYEDVKKFHNIIVKHNFITNNIQSFAYILWSNFLIEQGKTLNLTELYSDKTRSEQLEMNKAKELIHTTSMSVGIPDLDELFLVNSKELIDNLSKLAISNIYTCKIPSSSYICMYLKVSEKIVVKSYSELIVD